MNMITISWDDIEETLIKFSDDYESSDSLLKADLLKDAISDLTEEYEEVLELRRKKYDR